MKTINNTGAVYVAVRGAVNRALHGAVWGAVYEDPPHPALQAFLREVQ